MFRPFNPKQQVENIKQLIVQETKKAGFKKLIIGLSGGIDSTLAFYLAVSALGKENVFVALLPYKNLNPEGLVNAEKVIKILGVSRTNVIIKDISKICDEIYKLDSHEDKIRKGNIMARVRMILLFDQAKKEKALVLGTENKSEHLLGYYTRYGDEACDIEPIRHIYKTEVKKLAQFLKIPQEIINIAPSANLYQGQTDEKQFGFSYDLADPILYFLYEEKLTIKEIVKKGFDQETVDKVHKWYKANQFKFHVPITLKEGN